MPLTHGIQFEGSRFWVTHRRREYGPFDYEWSKDFCGIELTYRDLKFGEYCSSDEIFADMSPFQLPPRVVEVASIALGCTVFGILNGWQPHEREQMLIERLHSWGYGQFTTIVHRDRQR